MKRSKRWRLFFCMACILCIISDTTVVYAADPEGLEAVEEAQKTLQEKQMEHNEAIAEENRIAVEEAIREKTAAQYAAMGLSPAANDDNAQSRSSKSTAASDLSPAENSKNAGVKTEKAEITGNDAEDVEAAEDMEDTEDMEESVSKPSAEWKSDLSGDTGKVLNIYCWNEEFKNCMTDHYPGYQDNGDGTGSIGNVKVNWILTPTYDMSYQNSLDKALSDRAKASDYDRIDMFLIEDYYAPKYIGAKDVCLSMADLGLTDYMADQYQYTKDIVTDEDGNIKASSWLSCPGVYLYRRSAAKEVFGTDDPEKIQEYFSDWDTFAKSAQKLKDKGWKAVAGYDDAYRVFYQNVSGPWVVDGRIVIDDHIMDWVRQTKEFADKGFLDGTLPWSEQWMLGASSSGDVFGYFGCTWFTDYTMTSISLDNFDGEEAAGNGTWGDWAAIEGPQSYFWGGTWICTAQGSDNQGLAADIIYNMTCNPDIMKEIVKEEGEFCNNRPLMEETAAAGATNAFLGGENVTEKYCASAEAVSIRRGSAYDWDLSERFLYAMRDYFDGKADLDEALENFYTDAETAYPELSH